MVTKRFPKVIYIILAIFSPLIFLPLLLSNVVKMNKKKLFIIIAIIYAAIINLGIVLTLFLTPHLSKEERAEMIDKFSSFDNHDDIAFRDSNWIFLPDKTINVASIEYNDRQCYLIDCLEDRFYAYTIDSDKKHLLEIDYDISEIKYLNTINNIPWSSSPTSFYLQNKLYLGIYNGNYYVYDLDLGTYSTMSKDDVNSLCSESNQYSFNIIESKGTKHGIEITNKETQVTKTVTMDNLNAFAEGEYILSLDSYLTKRFFAKGIEKDGEIFILGMVCLETFANTKSECVVLKYDFDNDSLSYYSSMFYDWDEIPYFMYIF